MLAPAIFALGVIAVFALLAIEFFNSLAIAGAI